jgi:ankyrin repeat protein
LIVVSASLSIHQAYVSGDLDALRAALGDPSDFPNCASPPAFGETCLEYAIYWSPLAFIRRLLELGADPNYDDPAGFPALIAALSTNRADKHAVMELLLLAGADPQRRCINDYTPLHYAAARDDAGSIELLLAHGADPAARTNIDDYATPLEEAERGGAANAVRVLRGLSRGRPGG